jgi:hypothetical protein
MNNYTKEKENVDYGYVHSHCSEEQRRRWQEKNVETKIEKGNLAKVAFTEEGVSQKEIMWVRVTDTMSQYLFCGTLENDPVLIKKYKLGSVVFFTRPEIRDLIV